VSGALDPRDAETNSFQEAILGIAALSRELDALVAGLPPGDGPAPATPPDPRLLDVLLGLLSLRKTFGLTFDALLPHVAGGGPGEEAPSWSREHLR
jgi:hypothetical protein